MRTRTSRAHRIASMCVVGLLAANGAVLATGLANAVDSVLAAGQPRQIALITMPDGRQVAVDPSTPAGYKAIADAKKHGGTVTTVAVPDKDAAAAHGSTVPGATIPGVDTDDLQQLLTGKVDEIVTTVRTIVDSTGHTVVSVVGDATSTASSVVDNATSTASSVVDGATDTLKTTVTTVVDAVNPVTTLVTVPTPTVPVTVPLTVPTTVPVTVPPPTVPVTEPVTVPVTVPGLPGL